MIKLSKTESTRFNKIKNLLVKILGFGKKDIVECLEGQHFGIDSRPTKGQIAIIARTTGQEDVVLGYIPKDRLAQIGETRFYSTDANGVLKAFVWLKNNGDLLLNGDSLGGIVKIQDLKSQYDDNLLNIKTALQNTFNLIDGQLAALGQPGNSNTFFTNQWNESVLDLNLETLENTKVKHG